MSTETAVNFDDVRVGRSTQQAETQPKRRKLRVNPHRGGCYDDLNYDCTGALLEYAEGVNHR